MPGLARKLIILAAVDGLILQPLAQKGQRPAPAVKISYRGAVIGPALNHATEGKTFEAFGVVGLLTVSSASYLISITRRQQVAQIHGKPIYMITEVALTPLSSQKEAEAAIGNTKAGLQKLPASSHDLDDSDSEDYEAEYSRGAEASDDVEDDLIHPITVNSEVESPSGVTGHKRTSSVAEDVMAKKGGYGRFAQNWFSKNGWTADRRRNLGLSVAGLPASKATPKEPLAKDKPEAPAPAVNGEVSDKGALLPKLLKTTSLLFGSSQSFFFSYDYDITRSLGNQKLPQSSDIPLYREVDPLFFWNHAVIRPFIDAGQQSLVLPLMQGFVGQRSFSVDKDPAIPVNLLDKHASPVIEMKRLSSDYDRPPIPPISTTPQYANSKDESDTDFVVRPPAVERHLPLADSTQTFLLTLISRRSVKRAGLRYLRRGVDDDGNTANSVETEQILSSDDWSPLRKTFSFLQVRGSIPVFFSQSPYSFKPVPQMQHSADTNFTAFKQHFVNLSNRYGGVQVTSLVEKHNNEAIVGDAFESTMARLNNEGGIDGSQIGFEWFDFHAMCRGMKFENVGLLLDSLSEKLDLFGNTIELNGKIVQKQNGILRTNCMDCLDRTNVVQSACGRRALELQMKDEGFDLSAQVDQSTQWFNTLWADNGDAISKQYASTAALKGDFTRTRKRDYKGALTDMGLSISRFYSGIVNDYFSQAAIDFLVGNVTSLVFEDFEANMMSGDPAISVQKMRQQAIDVSQRLVVADEGEELVGGWALLTPHEPNTIKSTPFEESVLLLTDAALYACRFDWNMEKVSSFERVDLQHIVGIKYGTYITSTLSAAQADERRNVGFLVTFKAGANDITRVNTRSMSTEEPSREGDLLQGSSVNASVAAPTRIVAWKALPSRSAAEGDLQQMTELEHVKLICLEIERMVAAEPHHQERIVVESEIISLKEAQRSTGLLEQLGHNLKKLVWA